MFLCAFMMAERLMLVHDSEVVIETDVVLGTYMMVYVFNVDPQAVVLGTYLLFVRCFLK